MRFRLLCHLIQENPSTVMSFSYRGLRDATGMSTASIRDACVKLEEEGLVRISRPTKGGVFLDIEKLYERFEAGE